jgi:tripartite-type tricarboxylate transporter receptor subunit TctC
VLLPVTAQSADFYQGKTLTIIVGYAPGGGVDTGARLIARHIAGFIPGKPNVLVQNMPGAAGLVSANHIYAIAQGDGLTLAVPGREWPIANVLKQPAAQFDAQKLTWIGSSGPVNVIAWVRGDSGVRSIDDLTRAKEKVIIGGLGSATITVSLPKLLNANGIPFEVIANYDSTASILLAIERKEVTGIFTQESTFGRRHDLIDSKLVLPILQSEPQLPGVPLARDLLPSSAQPLLEAVSASSAFGLPLVGPPAMPPERVAILRQAFMDMAASPAFKEDAVKNSEPVGFAIEGARLAGIVGKIVTAMAPEVADAYKRLTEEK